MDLRVPGKPPLPYTTQHYHLALHPSSHPASHTDGLHPGSHHAFPASENRYIGHRDDEKHCQVQMTCSPGPKRETRPHPKDRRYHTPRYHYHHRSATQPSHHHHHHHPEDHENHHHQQQHDCYHRESYKQPRDKNLNLDSKVQKMFTDVKTNMLDIINEELQLKLEIRTMKEQFLQLLRDYDQHCSRTRQMTERSQQLGYQTSWRSRIANKRRLLEKTRQRLASLDLNIAKQHEHVQRGLDAAFSPKQQQQQKQQQTKPRQPAQQQQQQWPCSCSTPQSSYYDDRIQQPEEPTSAAKPDYNHNYRIHRRSRSSRIAPAPNPVSVCVDSFSSPVSSRRQEPSPRLPTIQEHTLERRTTKHGPKTSSPLYENVDMYNMRSDYHTSSPNSQDGLFDFTQSTILSDIPLGMSTSYQRNVNRNEKRNDESSMRLHTTPVSTNNLLSPNNSPEEIYPINIINSTTNLDLPSPCGKTSSIQYASSQQITQLYSSPRSPSPQRFCSRNSNSSNQGENSPVTPQVCSPYIPRLQPEQRTWSYRRNRKSVTGKHGLFKRLNHDVEKSDEGCVSDTETVLSDASVLTSTVLQANLMEKVIPSVDHSSACNSPALQQMAPEWHSRVSSSSRSSSSHKSSNSSKCTALDASMTPVMVASSSLINTDDFHKVLSLNCLDGAGGHLGESLTLLQREDDEEEPQAACTETELDEGNCSYKSETSSVCTESNLTDRCGTDISRQYAYVDGHMKVLKRQTGQAELDCVKPMIGLSDTDLADPTDSIILRDFDWNSPSSKYSSLDATRTSIPNLDEVDTPCESDLESFSDHSASELFQISGKSLDSSFKESDGLRSAQSVVSTSPDAPAKKPSATESPQSSNDSAGLVAPVNSPNVTDSSSSRPTTDTYDYAEIQNYEKAKCTPVAHRRKSTPGRHYGYSGRTPPTVIKRSQLKAGNIPTGRCSPRIVKTVTKTKTVTYSIPAPDTPTGPRDSLANPRRSLRLHHDRDSGFSTQGSNMSKHIVINDSGVMRTVVQHSAVARNLQHQRKRLLKKRLKQFSNNFYNVGSTGNLQIQTLAHF